MSVDFSQIHQFFISMAHTIVLMLYRVSTWILLSFGYQGNDAVCKLLAFVLVLFFLSFIFGLYWWPTRSAQPWLRVVLWPIIACLVLYTLFVFFVASADVLNETQLPLHAKTSSLIHQLQDSFSDFDRLPINA